MKNKILVTGADGFIGSHLVEQLLKKGFHVKATSYYNAFNSYGWMNNYEKNYNNLEKIQIDLSDSDYVKDIVKGCNYIFNLAALVGIPYSYKSPKAYVKNNLISTMNLLEESKRNKVKGFIQISTSEVYGTALYTPIDETHPLQAQSPYSASKIAADQMALAYFRTFNLPVNIIRPFNTFGPRQSLRAVIPTIIFQALDPKKKSIMLGSINPKRDFTYVFDTVEALIKGMHLKNFGNVINLGTGSSISVKNLCKLILEIINVDKKIVQIKNRKRPINSEVENLLSDNSRAKKMLRWKPKYQSYQGLRNSLIETIEWYKANKDLYNHKNKNYVI